MLKPLLSTNRLNQDAERPDGAQPVAASHLPEPPGSFRAVSVPQVFGCPVEPFTIAQSPRDKGVACDPGSPLRIKRVETPVAETGAWSFGGSHRLPEECRGGGEGQG